MKEFEYNGFHFAPVGTFPKNQTYSQTICLVSTCTEPFWFCADGENSRRCACALPYTHESFYAASGNSPADVFLCIETGLFYVPATNELFVYDGRFVPLSSKTAR